MLPNHLSIFGTSCSGTIGKFMSLSLFWPEHQFGLIVWSMIILFAFDKVDFVFRGENGIELAKFSATYAPTSSEAGTIEREAIRRLSLIFKPIENLFRLILQ
jgi:hypothetical protein